MAMLETTRRQVKEVNWDFPHHYTDLCPQIGRLSTLHYRALLQGVKKLAEPLRGALLDAGCGDGRFCYELRNEGLDIWGVDCSKKAVRFARAFNPLAQFAVQDLRLLSLPIRFNTIVMTETLEHINPGDIQEVLSLLDEHLYDYGKLIVTVPSCNLPVSPEHYQHFTKETLESTLKDYFEVNEMMGYARRGLERNVFETLRRLGVLGFPLLRRFPKIEQRYSSVLEEWYQERFYIGNPEECNGLIAVCRKK